MHRCKWCKRVIEDLTKAGGQCECGSRAFVFVRDEGQDAVELKAVAPRRPHGPENIISPEPGVFELNLESLAKKPAILLDENRVYHVLHARRKG